MSIIITNYVTITGEKKYRAKFLKLFEPYDGKFTFQAFIPRPKSLNIPESSEMQYAMAYAVVMAGGAYGKPPLDILKLLDPKNNWGLCSQNGQYARDYEEKLNTLWESIKERVERYPDNGSVDLNGDLSDVQLITVNEKAATRAEFLKYGRTAISNLCQYGYTDWYGWSVEHWGCKWGCQRGFF